MQVTLSLKVFAVTSTKSFFYKIDCIKRLIGAHVVAFPSNFLIQFISNYCNLRTKNMQESGITNPSFFRRNSSRWWSVETMCKYWLYLFFYYPFVDKNISR